MRSAVQARAVLIELDRQGLLDEQRFSAAFAATGAPAVCVEQVRQFTAQVEANRSWLLAG
ncbi:hypothetical protein [Kitasatospora griseola]|uniref:hypothetical protein n=1 Tax=Kitasatospora griseola TaxID=2064 RepID=UPI003435995A